MDNRKRGLYKRYKVKRLHDKKDKHVNCWFFVLDIEHDKFSRAALLAYIAVCHKEYPQLAADLEHALRRQSDEGTKQD